MSEPSAPLRTALFIDFDNIFLGLRQVSEADAQGFATRPSRWLDWLERQLEAADDDGGGGGERRRRRILVRRCYLNPRAFNRYRPYFIRAAFEVIDCPPLTTQGKTSADILMALDIVDALDHETRFDEFVVFSGDADFTPVLLRLRKHDRQTAVLAVGPASAAYEAAADLVIDPERFLEEALESQSGLADTVAHEAANREVDEATDQVLGQMARRLTELVSMTGGLQAAHLPEVYKEYPEFTATSNWLGFWSLRAMTEAVVARAEALALVEDDPWWVAAAGEGDGVAGAPPGRDSAVARFVRETLAASEEALLLATLAQALVDEFGEDVRAHAWQGYGSFKAFLETLRLDGLATSDVMPGFIYDPERHELPEEERRDGLAEDHPELVELARELSDLTGMPYLAPEQYAVLAREIATEVTERGFALTGTSKAVRDRMNGRGISIARAQVSFVLKGLMYSGYRFEEGEVQEIGPIARAIYDNGLILARRAQRDLTAAEEALLGEWILGALTPEERAAAEAATTVVAEPTTGEAPIGVVEPDIDAETGSWNGATDGADATPLVSGVVAASGTVG